MEERDVWTHCAINCAGRCPLRFHVVDGVAVSVHPDPLARACPRGLSMLDWMYSPHRLKWPLRRVGPRGSGRFERIGWDEALDEIASRLRRIIATYGNDAILCTYATGANATTARPFKRLLNCVGGFLDIYNNYSNAQITHMGAAMFGDCLDAYEGSDMIGAAQARMVVSFGNSPVETRQGGASSSRDWRRACASVLEAGGAVVVVDPRRNASIGAGVEWLPIRPGTDAALASALAWQFVADDAIDRDFVDAFVVGFDEWGMPRQWRGKDLSYRAYLTGRGYDHVEKTPRWASAITGIEKGTIVDLARRMEAADPLFVTQGWGPQRRSNGEMGSGSIMALPVLLGQVGRPGTNNGIMVNGGGGRLSKLPAGRNPVRASIPCYLFTDAVDHGHLMTAEHDGVREAERLRSDVKCIVNYGGNCLTNQHGDINRAHEVLADESKCEFILGVDVELCDSMRYADVVLPDLFRAEQPSVVDAGTFDPYVVVGSAVPAERHERRGSWEVCCGLADRLGVRKQFDEGLTQEQWQERLYEADRARIDGLPPFALAREMGVVHLEPQPPRVALEAFRRNPQGMPLPTPSGKIELFSLAIARMLEHTDLAGDVLLSVPAYVPEWGSDPGGAQSDGAWPLALVGYHYRGRVHSSWGNVDRLKSAYPQVMWMHPLDAAARGIRSGDAVVAFNERGALEVAVEVTDRIVQGAVALPQGAWHDASDMGARRADGTPDPLSRLDRGGNVNVLTSQRPSPLAKGNPQNTVYCQVERAEEWKARHEL